MKKYILSIFLGILLAGIPYFFLDHEEQTVTENIRNSVEGHFAQLSEGKVYYNLYGDKNGEVVVMIHGIASASFIWEHNIASLVNDGYTVLTFDLYGRGLTDKPIIEHDLDLYNRQLMELLCDLEIDNKINLVGISMGAAVAASFAANQPDMVKKLGLIAPVGLNGNTKLVSRVLERPLLGNYLMTSFGEIALKRGIKNNFYHPDKFAGFYQEFTSQMKFIGYKHAVRSSSNNINFAHLENVYYKVSDSQIPVFAIYGKDDPLVPYNTSYLLKEIIPSAEIHYIEHARHAPNYEYPDLVNPLLEDFLCIYTLGETEELS